MERRFCQSCGMPLGDETLLGMESSGKNAGNIVFIASKRALSPRTARWRKWRMPELKQERSRDRAALSDHGDHAAVVFHMKTLVQRRVGDAGAGAGQIDFGEK